MSSDRNNRAAARAESAFWTLAYDLDSAQARCERENDGYSMGRAALAEAIDRRIAALPRDYRLSPAAVEALRERLTARYAYRDSGWTV